MHLYDQRLSFALDLILHWSDIRGRALVPLKRDLDLRDLQRIIPRLTIMDTRAQDVSIVGFMGRDRLEPGLWPTVRGTNWHDLIPLEARELAARARKKRIETPCGVYYHYTASGADDFLQEAKTLVLPILTETESSTISVTDIVSRRGKLDLSRPTKLEQLQLDFVDIGAGVPEE
jgi:hypothetical protein